MFTAPMKLCTACIGSARFLLALLLAVCCVLQCERVSADDDDRGGSYRGEWFQAPGEPHQGAQGTGDYAPVPYDSRDPERKMTREMMPKRWNDSRRRTSLLRLDVKDVEPFKEGYLGSYGGYDDDEDDEDDEDYEDDWW